MICIDFSGNYIDIVVLDKTKNKLSVDSGVTLDAPADILTTNGDVNFDVLSDCLKPTLDQIAEKRVVMTFSFLPTIYSVLNLHKERNRQQQRVAVESQVFANISPDEYYVDYFQNKNTDAEDGKCNFITYAMPKKVVNGCYDMLVKLGKKPVALVPSQFAAENFINSFFPNETIALGKMDANNITLHLMNPPDNILTRDIVIDSAVSSLDVFADVNSASDPNSIFVQNIEKLNSYQNIKFPGKTIDRVLISGHSATNELIEVVSNSLGLKCEMLSKSKDEFSNSHSVYILGSILSLDDDKINFFDKNVNVREKSKGMTKKISIPIIVAGSIVAINIIGVAVLTAFNMNAQGLVDERQQELTSPETLALIQEYGSLRSDFVAYYKSELTVSSLQTEIAQIGEFNRSILNQIVSASPSGVDVLSASFSGNTYNLICSGTSEQQASNYVAILTNLQIFTRVDYFGYNETGTNVSFTVVCEL